MAPTTRSQGRRQGEADPYQERPQSDDHNTDEEDDSSSSDESASPAPESLVHGKSTIAYDLRRLSEASRARAITGLTGDFGVEECRSNRAGFDFQVADHGRVHVGQGPLTCSCRDFERSREACRHIFWLVDQLHRWVLPGRPEPGLPLLPSGQSPRFEPIIELIGDNMEDIAKKVKWPYLAGASSPVESGAESPTGMSRPDKARDIISAFSEATMPDEFRPELAEAVGEPRSPEECVVQGDFEATMFRLAVHDDAVYTSLRKVMPAGARAAIFFDKAQRRLKALLADFDRYRQTGAPRRDGRTLEIPFMVAELRALLQDIHRNVLIRSPLGEKAATRALMNLLHEVTNRNYDAYEKSEWDRRAPRGETDDDRNLYVQLICNMDEGLFVLDCLDCIPEPVLGQWASQLESVLEALRENGAPLPYLRKLQGLIAGERSGASSAPGRSKRPATETESSGSGRKRTR